MPGVVFCAARAARDPHLDPPLFRGRKLRRLARDVTTLRVTTLGVTKVLARAACDLSPNVNAGTGASRLSAAAR